MRGIKRSVALLFLLSLLSCAACGGSGGKEREDLAEAGVRPESPVQGPEEAVQTEEPEALGTTETTGEVGTVEMPEAPELSVELEAPPDPRHTVAAWGTYGTNVSLYDQEHSDTTIRVVVPLNIAGERVSVELSDLWGDTPLELGSVSIAKVAVPGTAQIDPATATALTFDGQTGVTIAPGELRTSDLVDMPVEAGAEYAVSFYLPGQASLTAGNVFNGSTYASTGGDHTLDAEMTNSIFNGTLTLETVNVETSDPDARAVVIVGDSTSCNAWPALLQERLRAAGLGNVSVIPRAANGGRLMVDCDPNVFGGFFGESVLDRYARNVLETPGVAAAILKIGVNDLFHPLTIAGAPAFSAEEMIAAETELIEQSRAAGVPVYVCTITPYNGYDEGHGNVWRPEEETIRQAINAWVASGATDGCIDLDTPMADPSDPSKLQEVYTYDHLHPTKQGMQAIADAVPLEQLSST